MMRLTTTRLVLEPVTPANAEILWRVMQRPHLREYQDIPRLGLAEFLQRVATRPALLTARAIGRFEWLVSVRADRAPIGWVSIRLGDHPRGVAEIGYSLVATHRRRGYASEAVRAVIAAALDFEGIDEIEACCVPHNSPSRRLLRDLGFSEQRIARAGAMVRGRPVDIVIYRLHRDAAVRRLAQSSAANSRVMLASGNP